MLSTLFHTLIHLKPIQAIYQVKNSLTKVGPLSIFQIVLTETQKLSFFDAPAIHSYLKVESDHFQFEYLNLTRRYPKSCVDWNDQSHGKLWNYNLQYLDFLKQEDVSINVKIDLVNDIYSWLWTGKLSLEPYPASLRIMNLIRFLSTREIDQSSKDELIKFLVAEVTYLSKNLEFHLLANHLLENAFAWWMGALFFNHQEWIKKSSKLLKSQLEEQILADGAHYELTPMYHRIILFRVLEAYYLVPNQYVLKFILKEKAELMLGWLSQLTFPNGSLPHFNDTTEGIAYEPHFLKGIEKSLGLNSANKPLKESGYRKLEFRDLRLVADLEGIKPSYQPGHAHADTFSFVLHQGKVPVIVDPGISTYTISPRRDWERSTLAHNTVTVNRKNSSQVWAGFRVGKRAKVILIKDNLDHIIAIHDGFGVQKHLREFKSSLGGFEIKDEIKNWIPGILAEARFYFHPDISLEKLGSCTFSLNENLLIEFDQDPDIQIISYNYAIGFNALILAKGLLITFKSNSLTTRIIRRF
jgi:uncharacterized heparinase superfamily protein